MSGGGDTPSPTPTPTPTTPTVFYRKDEDNDVYFMCNSQGKPLFTMRDGSNFFFLCNSDGTFNSFATDTYDLSTRFGVREVFPDYIGDSWSVNVDGTTYTYSDGLMSPIVSRFVLIDIWADEQCTVRPSGETNVVYAQLHTRFGYGQGQGWDMHMDVVCPDDSDPTMTYALMYYVDFMYDNENEPLDVGVYRLTAGSDYDVSNKEYSFI